MGPGPLTESLTWLLNGWLSSFCHFPANADISFEYHAVKALYLVGSMIWFTMMSINECERSKTQKSTMGVEEQPADLSDCTTG